MTPRLSVRPSAPREQGGVRISKKRLLPGILPVLCLLLHFPSAADASGFDDDGISTAAAASVAVTEEANIPSSANHRAFTNKEGVEMAAEVIAVGGSMRTVTIERPDGRRFEIEIIGLSLDDQQFLKEWLDRQPTPEPASLSIRIEAAASFTELSRERFEDRIYGGSGTHNEFHYQFSILHQGRQPLVGVRLEYALMLHDLVSIRPTTDDESETVRWRGRDQGPVVYRSGSVPLEPMKYNTAQQVSTPALTYEAVRGGSAGNSPHDIPIGVVARLVGKDGTVLAEYSAIDHDYPQLTWQNFESRRDASESEDGQGELVESVVTR